MRRVLAAFFRKELLQTLRDPRTRFVLFVVPIIQLVLFGYALSTDYRRLRLSVHAAAEWGDQPQALARCKADIATAHIVIAAMLFLEDHFMPVLADLQARRDHCDAMVCAMSAAEVTRLTRMGRFDMSAPASGRPKLPTRSTRAGAISMPIVLPAPAPGGQTTRLTPSLRATCHACTGPAPPVASNAYSAGIRPRSAIATRAAPAMFSFTTSCTPNAARPESTDNAVASRPKAASVATRSIFMEPPRKKSALR